MANKMTERTMRIHPNDVIVFSFPKQLSQEEREDALRKAEAGFPGHKVVILDSGTTIGVLGQQEQLDRVEAKLDALLEVLADEYDEEDDEPELSLDGSLVGGERDTSEAL